MSIYTLINNKKFIFITFLSFSFFLRIIYLDKYETWGDEKLSVSEANALVNYEFQPRIVFTNNMIKEHNSLKNVLLSTVQGDGGNGVIYITSLHYWTCIFGNSDFSVRFFSLVLGVLLVVIIYLFTKELFSNNKIAFITMGLIAIHPQLISYSQEARAYSIALLFTVSSTFLLLRMINRKSFNYKYLFPYTILFVTSFLSHYSTIYIFIAHFLLLIGRLKLDIKMWLKFLPYGLIAICLMLLWFVNYGFDGLKIIASRNHSYSELSLQDPTNSFYMKTGFYSIFAGWFQNILFFSGNTFVNLGLRILFILPLLTIPFYLIIQGLKNTDENNYSSIKLLFLFSFSSLIYATLLSLISGHIISFQQLYSIFSTPYFVILIGISIFSIYNSYCNKIKSIVYTTIIISQILIMLFSSTIIYFGFDSHTKESNNYEKMANDIMDIYLNNNNNFIITYNKTELAMEINKYLNEDLRHIKQVVDTSISNPSLFLLYPQSKERKVILN